MLPRTCKRLGFYTLMLCMALGLSGCATGYIVGTTQSVIGLDVSENPQTQVPHIRVGFCRSQYYYIPTGKSESKGGPSSGKADETPTLLSSLDVNMAFFQSTTIKEKFAVGQAAVGTEAAKTLFNPQYVPTTAPSTEGSQLIKQIGAITKGKPDLQGKGKDWININYPAYQNRSFTDFVINAPDDEARQKLLKYLQSLQDSPQ